MCVKLAMLYRQDTTTLTVWDTYSGMSKFLGEITGIFFAYRFRYFKYLGSYFLTVTISVT